MPSPTMTLDDLVTQLRGVHGDALRAVVLYGSAARGEEVAGRSDLNVLTVVDAMGIGTLRALGQTTRAWQEAGHPPVLTLTVAEWRASADIFPMEYADILEHHRTLAGVLPLEGIVVRPEDLRLQVEQEAMGKLLRLRRSIMLAGTETTRQQELLRASLSTLLVIFRGVLRLHGLTPPRDADGVIARVAALAHFDPAPFARVAALRRGTMLAAGDTDAVLAGYLTGMTALVAHLDDFAAPAPPASGAALPPSHS